MSGGLDSTAVAAEANGIACDWAVRTGLRHSRSITGRCSRIKGRRRSEARRGLSARYRFELLSGGECDHFQAGNAERVFHAGAEA